jgi:hypothetical protein
MKKFLLRFCFSLCCACSGILPVAAQEVFVPGPAKFITRFPFMQLTGGIIIIRACLQPYPDSLNFILDTGSGGISLDSTTVKILRVPNERSDRIIRGIAGMRTVNFAYNRTLTLPGLTVDSLNFHINDYELLSGVYGIPIDGIIGYSFFRRYIVRIDYDQQVVEIYKPGMYKYPKGGYLMRPTISGLPMQYATLRENRTIQTRFFLDTGAGLCLLLSEEYCNDSTILSGKRKRFKTMTEGLGGKKEMEMTVLKEFKLGPYKFKKMPIYIFDDEFNVTSYPYLGGLIGNDLLRRFNVVINYPRNEIHLIPNNHMRDPFDYAYSGLGLYLAAGNVIVSDVIPGSPADVAGLKVGDVVIGIGNNLSNSIQAYKALLQIAGTKHKLIIRRDDALIETKISVKSIL